jgi:chemosensory pili system protein ChpA (sensor histidine kinase/response regulator)
VTRCPTSTLARVLVADDDPGVLRAMAASLARGGFEVTTANDGAPAIELADTAAFDIVLVDLHMRTGGLAVVRHYKQRYGARVYCAVLSGEDSDATRADCLAVGADEVFVKPAPASLLRRRLGEAVLALRAAAVAHEHSA